ncbi:MAG: CoA transferase, partial [Chloroflexi bacterium]|nr:CoA transferase [Chloroflexota bacterium]
LEGLLIIDVTRQAPGPYCTMLLGDLGADVILVEEPTSLAGRRAEQAQGTVTPADDSATVARNAAFEAYFRNKRRITLNLKQPSAREVLHKLAARADVFVEGLRPGAAARLDMDYATLCALNPRLVYCSISGYGQAGEHRLLAGHDINYIAMGGALGLLGQADGPPIVPLNLLADLAGGGLVAAMGILAALWNRERTGRGQQIDVAMVDGVVSLLASVASRALAGGQWPRRGQHTLAGAVPYYGVYETQDGHYISVGAIEPWLYANLCRALGRDDLIPLQHDAARRDEVFAAFRAAFRTKNRDEWFRTLGPLDIPVAPVYDLEEALAQAAKRGMAAVMQHPEYGKVRQVGTVPRLSETPAGVRRLGVPPGHDTEAVLRDLDYGPEAIEVLRREGAI